MKLRLYEGRKNMRSTVGQRRIKMLHPVCNAEKMRQLGRPEGEACQDAANIVPGWWLTCPHDPYFSLAQERVRTPRREDVLDEKGNKVEGKYRITGYDDEVVTLGEVPNITQVSYVERINSGRGLLRKRRLGYILPEEHPEKPIAPYCQFLDCWTHVKDQNGRNVKGAVYHDVYGDYCEEWQAKLAAADILGRTLEIGSPNLPGSAEKRAEQLAGINVR